MRVKLSWWLAAVALMFLPACSSGAGSSSATSTGPATRTGSASTPAQTAPAHTGPAQTGSTPTAPTTGRPTSPGATAPPGAVVVTPSAGGPHARFTVSFIARAGRTSRSSLRRHYAVSARGPHGSGCSSTGSAEATGGRLGVRRQVVLSSPQGQGWCPGTYEGQIAVVLTPVCEAGQVCPMFMVSGGTIGRFSFRVNGR